MPEVVKPAGTHAEDDEPMPFMQRVLDDPFLLLFIGMTIPTILYLVWGVMEIATVPVGK
ncbi:MAG: hypothetical protein AB7K64_21100 [Variibacter sp.]